MRLPSQLYHCENLAEFLLQDKNDKCYKKVNKEQVAGRWQLGEAQAGRKAERHDGECLRGRSSRPATRGT